jgi:RNA polymerase sigma factor (sigma-70 family)
MSAGCLAPVLRHIHDLVGSSVPEGPSDACLLERFALDRDEDAFTALVRRHGPLVWRVCRRLLGRTDLAEDAFQATWIILARRVGSIRNPASLPSFLHGVAYRVGREARARQQRNATSALLDVPAPEVGPAQAAACRELGAIIEEEVHDLPERLRQPVLLCYWEGMSNEEAASRLGWPPGTVKTRLARARKRLCSRLTARGVTLPVGAVALLLAPAGAGKASVTTVWATATARAALASLAGGTRSLTPGAAGLVASTSTSVLGRGTRAALAVVLSLGLLAWGAALMSQPGQAGDNPSFQEPAAQSEAKAKGPKQTVENPIPLNKAEAEKAEAAMAAGLGWLVRQQAADGHWSMLPNANDTVGTAFGLLPLLGAGELNPAAGLFHPYAPQIERGLRALVRMQKADGGFEGQLYVQALATMALCEGYRWTGDPWLKQPARKALDYIVAAQHSAGGWRYQPGQAGDTSVTSWQILALSAGRAAGLGVPEAVGKKASAFLDSMASADGSSYGYVSAGQGSPAMTAAGFLCRFELGRPPTQAALTKAIAKLRPLAPPAGAPNIYFYHYATRLMRHAGGDAWREWQPKIRLWLLKKQDQEATSPDRGSWSPTGDIFAQAGGRLMITSLSLLTLQTCVPADQSLAVTPVVTTTEKGLGSLWDDLTADDFLRGRKAMRALAASPKLSVPFLASRLQPSADVPEKHLKRLIADLGAKAFATRERASNELKALGQKAVPALRRAVQGATSLEARRRAERLLEALTSPLNPESIRALRAVQILAYTGTAEARKALEVLAEADRGSDVALAARAALQRMARRPKGRP